jgi:hypothetical protein
MTTIYDTYFFDADITECAVRLAQHIADEHSDGLGLDDDDACEIVASDFGSYGDEDDSLYVELGEDTLRDRAAVANAKGGAA